MARSATRGVQAQVALDIAQVRFHQPHRGARVALFERVDDGHVFFLRMFGRMRGLVHQRDQRAARQQVGQQVGQHLVAEQASQHDVKVGQQPRAAGHVGARHRLAFGLQVAAQLGDLRVGDHRAQPLDHRRLEHARAPRRPGAPRARLGLATKAPRAGSSVTRRSRLSWLSAWRTSVRET